MFERVLYTQITEGLAELVENPQVVERHFRHRGLEETEIAKLRTHYEASNLKVIHGYPRSEGEMPCIAIILGLDTEAQQFLNDAEHTLSDLDAEAIGDPSFEGLTAFSNLSGKQFHLWVCATKSPDSVIYFYELLRLVLFRRRKELIDNGLLSMGRSGADVAPDLGYLPAHLFIRRLTLEVVIEEPFLDEPIDPIRSVVGLHVDDGTEYPGAITNVTPYSEDEEDEA